MLYVRINSLAYIVDEVDGLRSSIKIIFNEKDRNLELYFYSNRTYENHLRIYLMPCK
jgi:hypothetical protein